MLICCQFVFYIPHNQKHKCDMLFVVFTFVIMLYFMRIYWYANVFYIGNYTYCFFWSHFYHISVFVSKVSSISSKTNWCTVE